MNAQNVINTAQYLISVLRNHCASALCGFGIEHVQDVNVGGVVGRRRGHLTQGIDELVGVLIVHLVTNRQPVPH